MLLQLLITPMLLRLPILKLPRFWGCSTAPLLFALLLLFVAFSIALLAPLAGGGLILLFVTASPVAAASAPPAAAAAAVDDNEGNGDIDD